MKMVYLFNHFEVLEDTHIGIRKKMQMQMKSFCRIGYEPIYIVFDENKVVVKNMVSGHVSIYYFARLSDVYDFVFYEIKEIDPEFTYMRYRMIYTPLLFGFYQRLREVTCKVICEFYTYPYDTEFEENDLDYLMDRFYINDLRKIFKKSVNYNGYTEIMGISSISISNGIELDNIPLSVLPENDSREFNMIAVSTMFPWHGYDRLIHGISQYVKKEKGRRIKLHLVGDGNERVKYEKMVSDFELNEYVVFHGKIVDKSKLNQLFDKMDLAIGSIGMHRLSLENVSPIKSAEYCARGIPFVINYNDISFDSSVKFIKKISPDDTPVDIDELILFSKRCRNEVVSNEMRLFAEKNLTWDAQMRKVVDYIQN